LDTFVKRARKRCLPNADACTRNANHLENAVASETRLLASLAQLTDELKRTAAILAASASELRAQTKARPRGIAADMAAAANRHLVYVHGICRHDPGYSDPWWNSLHPFTDSFGNGDRGDTRQEVLWSDLVNESSMAAAAVAAKGSGGAHAEWTARVRGVLEERSAALAAERGPSVLAPDLTASLLARNFGAANLADSKGLSVPGLNCVDDFTVYMFDDSVRAQIVGRFTEVVKPLLDSGAELDIISHSWGTVVAYEGLRELEDSGMTQANVRNFFTVGAALSIFLVKQRLRPANRDGRRPAMVRRWVNLNAVGDPVGGRLQGRPYQVDVEFLNLANLGCGLLDASCAHGSYFQPGNVAVNRDIFAHFIDEA
jgi:hypothetical protein